MPKEELKKILRWCGEFTSICFTFKNYDKIWEIGGVHTAPAQRRKGLARLVVEAALYTVLSRGYIPRYQVAEANIPSIRLAETLGLTRFVVAEHYLYCFEGLM